MSFDWDDYLQNRLQPEDRLMQSSMTEIDHTLKTIWNCAFPDGLQYREWSQLIHLMYVVDGGEFPMTFRAVAHNVGILLNVNYLVLLNEAYGTRHIEANQEILAWLRQRLQACGYYEWLKED